MHDSLKGNLSNVSILSCFNSIKTKKIYQNVRIIDLFNRFELFTKEEPMQLAAVQ